MQSSAVSYVLLILAQLMVSVSIVGSKALLQTTPADIILTARFAIGCVILFLLHVVFSKDKFQSLKTLNGKDWFYILLQALCAGAFFNLLLLLGLKFTTASVAGIITSALPAVVAVFSIIFLKERITLFTSACIIFSILGLLIINMRGFVSGNTSRLIGDLLIFLSLLPEAGYYILVKFHKNKLPIFLVSALMNGINIPVFYVMVLITHDKFPPNFTGMQILLLFVLGVSSALFYVFWILGCRQVRASMAALTTAVMPIGTLFIAWLFLGESITLMQLIGMLLVILAIIINALKGLLLDKRKQAKKIG